MPITLAIGCCNLDLTPVVSAAAAGGDPATLAHQHCGISTSSQYHRLSVSVVLFQAEALQLCMMHLTACI